MRIIKSSKTIECTCIQCGSILEVEPQDIKTSDVGHPYGAWFTCPICGKNNSMDSKIPKTWVHIVYKNEPF